MKLCTWWNQQLVEVLLVHARRRLQHTWVPVVREHLRTLKSSPLSSPPSPTAKKKKKPKTDYYDPLLQII